MLKDSVLGRVFEERLVASLCRDIHDVTYENVQARERTQILMDLANKEGGLLIGTGDFS